MISNNRKSKFHRLLYFLMGIGKSISCNNCHTWLYILLLKGKNRDSGLFKCQLFKKALFDIGALHLKFHIMKNLCECTHSRPLNTYKMVNSHRRTSNQRNTVKQYMKSVCNC